MTKGWHHDEQRWLERFRDALAADYGDVVEKAVLFGSKARGDWRADSDIDVMVIVKDEAADALESIADMGHELVYEAGCWKAAPCGADEDQVRVGQGSEMEIGLPRDRRARGDHAAMNSDMAKRHWKWATNALNAANRDALNHDPQNAVSRAYYAMMHAANAALALKDLQPKTHSGTQMLFNEHLVRPGHLDKQRGRDLARGQERRTSADYDVSKDVSESQAHDQCRTGDCLPDRNPDPPSQGRTARRRIGRGPATARERRRGYPARAGVNPPAVLHGKNATIGSERGIHHDGCARRGR